jgi:hypothetical protein
MKHFAEKEEHESFGLLQISRQTCSPAINLFGSSIAHSNLISLRICRGEKHRDLSHDWYFDSETLVEVIMSNTQFAEAITSLNTGCGVPVTLHRVHGKDVAPCPEVHKRKEIEREFAARCKTIADRTQEAADEATKILSGSGTLKKEDRKKLSDLIFLIQQEMKHNLPFVNKSFDEQIDKTITEAKGECEAFFTNAVHKLGIEALHGKSPALVGYESGTQTSQDLETPLELANV